jgi:flagellar operon protein
MVERVGSIGLPEVAANAAAAVRPASPPAADGLAFDQILQQRLAEGAPAVPQPTDDGTSRVRFSAHAQERLAQAAVQLGPQALAKLEAAVDKAGEKGGKDSLILLDDLAFVVSVQNRTVITAVGANRLADNVFTKIDSVVIAGHSVPAAPSVDTELTQTAAPTAPLATDA